MSLQCPRCSVGVALLLVMAGMLAPGAAVSAEEPTALGQGLMAGEPTETSILLQARLTRGERLISNDLPGAEGVGRFHLAASPQFADARITGWLRADDRNDHIIRAKIDGLEADTQYYYRLEHGADAAQTRMSAVGKFRTLAGAARARRDRIAVVTGLNYAFFHGLAPNRQAEPGADRHVGYPGLEGIVRVGADYLIGTGDTVYYDHPGGEEAARSRRQLRRKWHEQFVQRRFHDLFAAMPAWWQVDDHDFRYDDADLTGDTEPSPQLGRATFLEQLPVTDGRDPSAVTWRTHRVNRDLQIWLVEGRFHRSPNRSPDGPDKTIWGDVQRRWLQRTLSESDASFRLLVSPTPMIGPDREGRKIDNHVNANGFRHERDSFFAWLQQQRLPEKGFAIVCGDRHWQYHSIHPSGVEEFSCGALTDSNSVPGIAPGAPRSSDPEARLRQPYMPSGAVGGFLVLEISPARDGQPATLTFRHHSAAGDTLYTHRKTAGAATSRPAEGK